MKGSEIYQKYVQDIKKGGNPVLQENETCHR